MLGHAIASRFQDNVESALVKCPELMLVHTATYAPGETVPGYHENPTRDYKVRWAWRGKFFSLRQCRAWALFFVSSSLVMLFV